MDQDLNFKGNDEIGEALKKFQEEKEQEQLQKKPLDTSPFRDEPKMVRFLIKNGIVSNHNQANIVLLVVALLMFALSIYFFFGGTKTKTTPVMPPLPVIRN